MFKFEIGQIVTTKVGIEQARRMCAVGYAHSPTLFMVLERRLNEHPGGTLCHYTVSSEDGRFSAIEIELALPDEFDYAGEHIKAEAEQARKRAARTRWEIEGIKAKAEGN